MKRSEINALIQDTKEFFAAHSFRLPKWAFWRPEDWKGKGDLEVVQNMLGWDITDYGGGNFEKKGLILFTIRNGNQTTLHPKKYAEKIMVVREGQICPMHFHWSKTEDIINRGGGNLIIELYNSDAEEQLADSPVTALIDGIPHTVPAGGTVTLEPGESIFLPQGMYHRFYGQPGCGKVLVGEVSSVNDDNTDNRFHNAMPRFPEIEEDEAPLHLLVTDYPRWI